MNDDDQDPLGKFQDRQPWFGPKRFGYGYGPRTWQGYLVTAVLAACVVIIATLTKKGHSPWMLIAIIPLIGVPFIIGFIQRR
jgi:hypothetical protein